MINNQIPDPPEGWLYIRGPLEFKAQNIHANDIVRWSQEHNSWGNYIGNHRKWLVGDSSIHYAIKEGSDLAIKNNLSKPKDLTLHEIFVEMEDPNKRLVTVIITDRKYKNLAKTTGKAKSFIEKAKKRGWQTHEMTQSPISYICSKGLSGEVAVIRSTNPVEIRKIIKNNYDRSINLLLLIPKKLKITEIEGQGYSERQQII